MNIVFFFEYGQISEIGTGHKYRSEAIGNELKNRGHNVFYISDSDIPKNTDVLIIDHIFKQDDLIAKAKNNGTKVVLIDGAEENTEMVDLSISCCFNKKAQFSGIKYLAFETKNSTKKYWTSLRNCNVFIGVGGFDKNNYTIKILQILKTLKRQAYVAKPININDLGEFDIKIINESNYFDAMNECGIAITNGGLTFFQSLFFGMPTIAIPQYEHQKNNIEMCKNCCIICDFENESIKEKIELLDSCSFRQSLRDEAIKTIDGKGIFRICNLIEGIK